MKNFRFLLTITALILAVFCLSAFQEVSEEMIIRDTSANEPVIDVNPVTGLPITNPSLLTIPPVFVPLARYPSAFRPSKGHSQAHNGLLKCMSMTKNPARS